MKSKQIFFEKMKTFSKHEALWNTNDPFVQFKIAIFQELFAFVYNIVDVDSRILKT